MALLVIVDEEGREHLIHSSQIGPQHSPRIVAPNPWPGVWERFDRDVVRPNDPAA